jgi:hypothetical protein
MYLCCNSRKKCKTKRKALHPERGYARACGKSACGKSTRRGGKSACGSSSEKIKHLHNHQKG